MAMQSMILTKNSSPKIIESRENANARKESAAVTVTRGAQPPSTAQQ